MIDARRAPGAGLTVDATAGADHEVAAARRVAP
jgi:hypothetical protein